MSKSLTFFSVVFGLLLTGSICEEAYAANSFKLKKGRLQNVKVGSKRYLCGSPTSRWVPVKKASSNNYSQLKSASTAHKSACATLIPRGAVKSLSQLPDVSGLTKASRSAPFKLRANSTPLAVSGLAPVVPSVPSIDVTQLFWRAGVVSAINSGSPSQEQCNEFWGSNQDGHSSGQVACYMLQDVGQSIGNIQQSGTSLCYFKNMAKPNVVASGAARIVRGSVPGGVGRVFDAPDGSRARIIAPAFSGQDREQSEENSSTYIRIAPRTELDSAGLLYKFDIWDCRGEILSNRETGIVRINGDYVATQYSEHEDSTFSNEVKGFITVQNGELSFDTTRDRSAVSVASRGDELSKGQIVVTSGNELVSKHKADGSFENRMAYSVSNFSGDSVADLRFLSGASKLYFSRDGSENSFIGSSEYRDSYYAAAPESALASRIEAFSFESDPFYSTPIVAPSPNSRGVSCSPTVDVEMTLDTGSSVIQQISEECEGTRLEGFNMCNSDAVNQAQQNFHTVCGPPLE